MRGEQSFGEMDDESPVDGGDGGIGKGKRRKTRTLTPGRGKAQVAIKAKKKNVERIEGIPYK